MKSWNHVLGVTFDTCFVDCKNSYVKEPATRSYEEEPFSRDGNKKSGESTILNAIEKETSSFTRFPFLNAGYGT